MQYDLGLYLSLFVSLGFVCIRPSPQLHPVRPARRLVSLVVLGPVALFMALYITGQGIAVGFLRRQSWYHPTENQVREPMSGMFRAVPMLHDLSKPKGLRGSPIVFQQLKLTLPITINSHTPSQLLSTITLQNHSIS